MSSFIGHQRQWHFLKKIAASQQIPQAILFSGQEGLGKKKVALEFVKLIAGKDVLERENPDLFFISSSEKEIQISQIRDLIWNLSLKPIVLPFKIGILDNAHLMTKEAQSALLKTLEEPKGNALLILITQYPELLLPTILSRVLKIKFYPVKREEIENYLDSKNIKAREKREIIEISQGRPGKAIQLFLNPEKLEFQNQKIKELQRIINSDLSFRFRYVNNLSKEKKLKEVLEIWLRYFREKLIKKIKGEKRETDYSLQRLKNILEKIQMVNFLISSTNINSRLALEILMLEF